MINLKLQILESVKCFDPNSMVGISNTNLFKNAGKLELNKIKANLLQKVRLQKSVSWLLQMRLQKSSHANGPSLKFSVFF